MRRLVWIVAALVLVTVLGTTWLSRPAPPERRARPDLPDVPIEATLQSVLSLEQALYRVYEDGRGCPWLEVTVEDLRQVRRADGPACDPDRAHFEVTDPCFWASHGWGPTGGEAGGTGPGAHADRGPTCDVTLPVDVVWGRPGHAAEVLCVSPPDEPGVLLEVRGGSWLLLEGLDDRPGQYLRDGRPVDGADQPDGCEDVLPDAPAEPTVRMIVNLKTDPAMPDGTLVIETNTGVVSETPIQPGRENGIPTVPVWPDTERLRLTYVVGEQRVELGTPLLLESVQDFAGDPPPCGGIPGVVLDIGWDPPTARVTGGGVIHNDC